MEPVLYKLLQTYGQRIKLRFKMAGLISDTTHIDPNIKVHSVPFCIEQLCSKVSTETSVKINPGVWKHNQPVTSHAACTAFKCADRQGEKAGALYLSLLRLAAMGQGKDISNTTTLLSIAQTVSAICPEFDPEQFSGEFENGSGYLAMEEDFRDARSQDIEGVPCMMMERNGQVIRLRGYQNMEQLAEAMRVLLALPEQKKNMEKPAPKKSVYLSYR